MEEVIGVEDWAEIRRLHRAEGMSIKLAFGVVRAVVSSGSVGDTRADSYGEAFRTHMRPPPVMFGLGTDRTVPGPRCEPSEPYAQQRLP